MNTSDANIGSPGGPVDYMTRNMIDHILAIRTDIEDGDMVGAMHDPFDKIKSGLWINMWDVLS